MGQVTIPKHTAGLDEIIPALKIYYEAGVWLDNAEHTAKLKNIIGSEQYPSSYTKKSQFLTYYGFTEWNPEKSSQRRITERGKTFYEHYIANDQEGIYEDMMIALETTTFGRNNNGVESSNSDVEPPNLLMRALIDLDYIINREYTYLLWKLAVDGGNYTDVIEEIKERRLNKITDIPDEANQPAYNDLKIILFLVRLGFLVASTTDDGKKCTRINDIVKTKYEKRIRNLKIFNVDKSIDDKPDSLPPKEVALMIEKEELKENYTIEELGEILSTMYESAKNKTTAIHMFGIKYGPVIRKNKFSAASIVSASNISESYHVEVSKGTAIYDSILANQYGIKFYDGELVSESKTSPKSRILPKLSPRIRKRYSLNSILYGAPGTGKTYATAQYALAIIEDQKFEDVGKHSRETVMSKYNDLIEKGQIVFTTFHQNYGYEDFIQGIRPDTSSDEMKFVTADGVLKIIADRAMNEPEKDFIIIIDEINRANISKVFGELITLIEDDKRWGELNAVSVTLPSGESFAIPNNLYILGTMNSADKSISLIDTALRRRFDFVEFTPNIELVTDKVLKSVLVKLNEGLKKELNSTDLLIGHAYFMNKTEKDICNIMNKNIIPLLYEYFFDHASKVEAQLKKALDGLNIKIESENMGRIRISDKGE